MTETELMERLRQRAIRLGILEPGVPCPNCHIKACGNVLEQTTRVLTGHIQKAHQRWTAGEEVDHVEFFGWAALLRILLEEWTGDFLEEAQTIGNLTLDEIADFLETIGPPLH